MDWNCTFTEERLSEAVDGLLAADEAAAYAAHLAACPACAAIAARITALVTRMRSLEFVEESPELHARILDATLGPRKAKAGWEKLIAWLPGLLQPRFAMGMATVAASFVIVLHTAGITPNKLKRADLSPGSVLRAANRQVHLTYARGVKFVNDLRVVYEIQSRLQPEPQPATAPVHPPAQQEKSQPPDPNPQQKSQTQPGHSQIHGRTLLASLMLNSFPTEKPR
jgi:anti-sigma factor RsiW